MCLPAGGVRRDSAVPRLMDDELISDEPTTRSPVGGAFGGELSEIVLVTFHKTSQ